MSENKSLPNNNAETVLLVADEVLVRAALSAYLRDCGYRVLEAISGDEAVGVLKDEKIKVDIVFSDVQMEGQMSGFDLAKWMRENRPDVQIILAGTISQSVKVAGELCEQGPHLAKPYEPQQVLEWIKKLRALKPE
jgi:CheY-like chemotaxis protein